jgi:hypothetical protein
MNEAIIKHWYTIMDNPKIYRTYLKTGHLQSNNIKPAQYISNTAFIGHWQCLRCLGYVRSKVQENSWIR